MSHSREHRNLGTTDADLAVVDGEPVEVETENNAKLGRLLAKMRREKANRQLTPMSPATAAKNISSAVDSTAELAAPKTEAAAQLPTITTIAGLREVLNSNFNILILDMEFYGTGSGALIRQIAGRIYGTHEQFHYSVFNSTRMKANEQLKFLRKTNFTFQQAAQYDSTVVVKRINEFLQRQPVSYLLSFDNNLDLTCLEHEAKTHHWKDELQFWHRLKLIDLSKIVRESALDGKLNISLSGLVKILGLSSELHFHQAANDVAYIDRILNFYSQDWDRLI